MCVYMCMYVYICVYICVYMCIYICMCVKVSEVAGRGGKSLGLGVSRANQLQASLGF
jgi:hypothetical protein